MDLPTVQGYMSLSPIVVPTKKKRLEAGMNGITSRPKPSIGAGLRDTQRSPEAPSTVTDGYAAKMKMIRTSVKSATIGRASNE